MNRKYLEELGLDKEKIDSIMAEQGKTVESHKADKIALEKQISDLQESLKTFEGIKPEELTGKIAALTKQLADTKNDYDKQLAERDFSAMLDTAIASMKGRSAKAVKSMLDIETLKSSKNQKEDVTAAIAALQKSDAYLFGDTSETTPAKVSTGGTHNEHADAASASANAHMNALIRGNSKGE